MTRRALLALLLWLGLSGTALAVCEGGGIGGTGVSSDGGMGGTGRPADPTPLGLIGVISGFGSICVNGVEVEYDAATPISAAGAPASAASLALGQVVLVQATGTAQSARAHSIRILEAAVGPVSTFDPAAGVLQVGAQRVLIEPTTVLAGLARADLAARPAVRVAGLWRTDGTIAATRVERASADTQARAANADWPDPGGARVIVEGYVRSLEGSRVNVGGLNFEAGERERAALRTDERVRVTARVEGDRRIVERAERPREMLPERRERGDQGDSERGNRGPDRRGSDRPPERPERVDRPDRGERPDRAERPDRSGRH